MSFRVNVLLPPFLPHEAGSNGTAGEPQAFHKAKKRELGSWGPPRLSISARPVSVWSRRAGAAISPVLGAVCSGRACSLPAHSEFGQAAAAFLFPTPRSWLNILPVSSPAVLGCCSRQPFPRCPPSRTRRESLVPAPWAQPGASAAVGDLHCFLLSLSDPKHQTRSREGAPGGPRWPRNCAECHFRERIKIYIF